MVHTAFGSTMSHGDIVLPYGAKNQIQFYFLVILLLLSVI